MQIKLVDSISSLLLYLVESRKLTAQEALNFTFQGTFDGKTTLGALSYLLLGIKDANALF